ncbi:GNAT family N-acetyltransferase [Yoonia sediminilitoris]|uniref:Acetyltransferase (GNAT) family protein n=1 Tax=Yoonia sediminilitoris TaxID=1286148 RepID=A0A2T6K610_9RHOB|nr:GNAT family N-acetyltransferase [Yoonia sediminilitoris]PUB10069.1 acetyltransferase (GNAT) family protein [Yoonia sediminilitoris]RCW89665.1 acetyltransferase (GNAT) family protein [Yoonia sediminilitoris]
MTIATSEIEADTSDSKIVDNAQRAGVDVPCLHGFAAKTFHSSEDIPREIAHSFLLEYIATQAEVYERVNGAPVDAQAHIEAFWMNIDKVVPPQGSYYLVWSDKGELVGTGALRRADESTGEMKHLYVRPKARGTGLGRWLVEQRIRDARAMGLKSVIADTLRGNVEMPALYAKLGFFEEQPNHSGASLTLMPHLASALRFFRMEL